MIAHLSKIIKQDRLVIQLHLPKQNKIIIHKFTYKIIYDFNHISIRSLQNCLTIEPYKFSCEYYTRPIIEIYYDNFYLYRRGEYIKYN
jgi:hypothetical protein